MIPQFLKAVLFVVAAGLCFAVSQSNLSPVYGTYAAGLYHQKLSVAAFCLGWFGKGLLRNFLSSTALRLSAPFAFWIPAWQAFLFRQSSLLGPAYGPLLTELLTYFPLVVLSIYSAARAVEHIDFRRYGTIIADGGPALGTYIAYRASNDAATYFINRYIGQNIFVTRSGLKGIIAFLYALQFPSIKLMLLAIPTLLPPTLFNGHFPPKTYWPEQDLAVVTSTYRKNNFNLVARNESVTGYISVFEDNERGFRVMRCDHSLLGGHYVRLPPDFYEAGWRPIVHEPVYNIFVMMEAIRLIENDGASKGELQTALVM